MTIRGINGSVSDEVKVPDFVQHKVENIKTEAKLINNKEVKVGSQITAIAKNIGIKRQIKVSLEIINYSDLDIEPSIPKYGCLISEILKIVVLNQKGTEAEKFERDITYCIKCANIDKYCYPLIFIGDKWIVTENFEIDENCVKINEGNWNMIVLVKEHPFDIINVSTNGGLLHSKLDHLISLRIPKGNFKDEVVCKIQTLQMPLDYLDQFRLIYNDHISLYLNMSQMFVIGIVSPTENTVLEAKPFRRIVTVKLPLPDWVSSILANHKLESKNVIKDQKKEKLGFYFLQKIDDSWDFVESNLKFTENSLEFDSKYFGSFIFVKCRENREIKLCQNMKIVENLMMSENGVVLTFLWIKGNSWFLWIEIVPICQIRETRSKLEAVGFIFIEQTFEPIKFDENRRNSRYSRKFSKTSMEVIQRKSFELRENLQFKISVAGDLDRATISKREIVISVNIPEKSNGYEEFTNHNGSDFSGFDKIGVHRQNSVEEHQENVIKRIPPDLSYHKHTSASNALVLPINPIDRKYTYWETMVLNKMEKRSAYENSLVSRHTVTPTSEILNIQSDIDSELIEATSFESKQATRLNNEEKEFYFFSEVRLEAVNLGADTVIPSQIFRFYIPVDAMKQYFQIKTKEEKQNDEKETELKHEQIVKEKQVEEIKFYQRKKVEVDDKPKQINYSRLSGLAKPRFINTHIEREPKIISRRSLLALSSIVRQGLKLAVYLSIPDSMIAGIGFDALSQMSMNSSNNTTYKVLILWKKMILYNKMKETEYVEQLIDGLKSIGYERIGELVYDRWIKHEEISAEDCQRSLLQKVFS